ncbi:unnamed protein product [Peronospora belbahrii]|uniref:Uncharacterized protein n=1 Tax=Peronospora belbahrii TaxID=622444 RepID=A0AAU9L5A4_9STRA|nr:unnamed protein product [Peronospora belbahrii]CAH0519922.1 unnamed protein product [Peronospora belbahrii]
MLPVKCLAAFVVVCVTHTSVVSGEGYSYPEHSTKALSQEQLVLTPIVAEMQLPETTLPLKEDAKAYVATPAETPPPERVYTVDNAEMYVPNLNETPCTQSPIHDPKTESEIEAFTSRDSSS